jgi:hypothetical protein
MSEAQVEALGLEETVRAQSVSRLVYRRAWSNDVWHWRWECRYFPMWQYQASLGEPSSGPTCPACAAIAEENKRYE